MCILCSDNVGRRAVLGGSLAAAGTALLAEGHRSTAADLDRAGGTLPIWAAHTNAHMGVANVHMGVADVHMGVADVRIHGNGDAAIDDLLDAYESAIAEHGRRDHRMRIEHAQTVREDQPDRVRRLGVQASFFVSHTYYWGDPRRDIFLGPEQRAENPLTVRPHAIKDSEVLQTIVGGRAVHTA
ncbi:amidohydrolase family protein [Actinomadura gamaensis]|uniref:Amidohydrolase family protein n=1 Tax=Actinomadura gamaensis TaxID=1763541 RepID=A0ABV9U1L3_9ACTN